MIRPTSLLLAAAITAFIPAVIAGCTVQIAGGDGCVVNGVWHSMDDSWKEDCNSCACNEDGTWGCTLMACPVCTDSDGKGWYPGDTFPSLDGCNTCTCDPNGEIACTEIACAEDCTYNGEIYAVGDTFPAGDGCNTCTCEANGGVSCTLQACVACTYAGQTYTPGQSFPALDGCNTCTCDDAGTIGCTKIACACDPSAEWWRHYVGSSPAACETIDYACPANTTMFGNDCGCGCEQDASCPEYFDCMPPNPCDVQKIKDECPYSGIAF